MKPLAEWTEANLQELIGTDEGQSVDFKQSVSIDLSADRDKRVKELIKDVSAMANAAGGRIFYGIVEEKGTGRAERLDDGLAAGTFNLDQIGNLLTSNIEPSIPGVTTHAIRLANGRFAIVIDIPQSTTLAPHQSRIDRIYHRRHDRKTLAMFDHEIRDVMRRAKTPEIVIKLEYTKISGNQHSIAVCAKNESEEPALYYVVDVMAEVDLTPSDIHNYQKSKVRLKVPGGDVTCHAFSRTYVTPNAQPMFKPRWHQLADFFAEVDEHKRYWMAVTISAPGFHGHWLIELVRMGDPVMAKIERQV